MLEFSQASAFLAELTLFGDTLYSWRETAVPPQTTPQGTRPPDHPRLRPLLTAQAALELRCKQLPKVNYNFLPPKSAEKRLPRTGRVDGSGGEGSHDVLGYTCISRFFWTGNSWLPAPPLDLFIGAQGSIDSALLPPSVLAAAASVMSLVGSNRNGMA